MEWEKRAVPSRLPTKLLQIGCVANIKLRRRSASHLLQLGGDALEAAAELRRPSRFPADYPRCCVYTAAQLATNLWPKYFNVTST